MSGPKPLPKNVHVLRGNPSKKPLNNLMDDLQPEVEIPSMPGHLYPEAKKEWKRVTVELLRYGLISKLDRAALCLYVQSYAEMVWAEQQVQRAMKQAMIKMKEAEEKGEVYLGGDGMTTITSNNNVIYSPHWIIAQRSRANVDRFLANFGMSPSSRSKVTISNNRQIDMFGVGQDESATGMGAI